jgi:hypothetical protein
MSIYITIQFFFAIGTIFIFIGKDMYSRYIYVRLEALL